MGTCKTIKNKLRYITHTQFKATETKNMLNYLMIPFEKLKRHPFGEPADITKSPGRTSLASPALAAQVEPNWVWALF